MTTKKCQTVRGIQKMDIAFLKKSIKYCFACECGKKYDTYPALYLHFKRNHKIKISTKLKEQCCKMFEAGNQRIFIYYYTQKNMNFQTNDRAIQAQLTADSDLQTIIKQFLEQKKLIVTVKQPLSWLFPEFIKFILNFKHSSYGKQSKIIGELPTFFNQFILVHFLSLTQKCLYHEACLLLLELGNWMNQKKYTDYLIQLNKCESVDKQLPKTVIQN